MSFLFFIILVIIIGFIVDRLVDKHTCVSPDESTNLCYNVLNNTENMKEKATLLYKIDNEIQKLREYIIQKYPNNEITKKFMERYKLFSSLSEAEIETGSTTFTINKSEIFVCLESRTTSKEMYDMNTLMYVLIHELGHICNDTIGHTKEFNETFAFLLKNAVDIGIYKYVDYEKSPINYCGLTIDTNILNLY